MPFGERPLVQEAVTSSIPRAEPCNSEKQHLMVDVLVGPLAAQRKLGLVHTSVQREKAGIRQNRPFIDNRNKAELQQCLEIVWSNRS